MKYWLTITKQVKSQFYWPTQVHYIFHFNILTHIWIYYFPFWDLSCGWIGALTSVLSPKSKICSCSLASSQALTDTVLGYGFQTWPSAWGIFNHVRERHKPVHRLDAFCSSHPLRNRRNISSLPWLQTCLQGLPLKSWHETTASDICDAA